MLFLATLTEFESKSFANIYALDCLTSSQKAGLQCRFSDPLLTILRPFCGWWRECWDYPLQEKHGEIERLKIELAQASNPAELAELAELRARNEELQAHNDTLKNELEKAGQRYDNYMAQMQTLIKQKAIEAPGAKKPWWRFW